MVKEDRLIQLNIQSQRIDFIDVARGIAALLVIIGHSIQVADYAFDYNVLFRFIYSFHMPLFMFLSGYVTYRTGLLRLGWICRKVKHLLLPFVTWTILPILFSNDKGELGYQVLKVIRWPDYSFWFLLILFYCDVLVIILNRLDYFLFFLERKICFGKELPQLFHEIFMGVLTVGLLILVKLGASIHSENGLSLLAWHGLFFFSGFWIRRSSLSLRTQKCIFAILGIAWVPLALTWSRIKLPDFVTQLSVHLNQWQFKVIAECYNYIVGFSGIGFSLLCAIILCKHIKCKSILSIIGSHTIELYVMQGLFYNIVKTPFLHLNILINIVLGTTMPLLICFCIRHKKIGMLLWGKIE